VAVDTTQPDEIFTDTPEVVPDKFSAVRRYRPRLMPAICIAVVVQIILLLMPPMPDDTAYLASINDKDKRLSEIPGPRVLLIGGSNLTFGVDSVELQRQLGIPVLNQSLCSPIGLRFMLRHVGSKIHPGDIVVISPEYSHFGELQDGSTELTEMLWTFPQGLKYLSMENASALVQSLTGIFQHKITFWQKFGIRPNGEDSVYRRSGFNGHGDLISHLQIDDHKKIANDFQCNFLSDSPEVWSPTINILAQFNHHCKLHQAQVVLAYPPIPTSSCTAPVIKKIGGLSAVIREKAGISYLSDLKHSVYPNSEFFMTLYHLASKGRAERTRQLAQELKLFMTTDELNAAASAQEHISDDVSHGQTSTPSKLQADLGTGPYRCGIGAGWYPLEHFGTDNFRWANNDSEIWLPLWHNPDASFVMTVELEPGPCLGEKRCLITLLDDHDQSISSYSLSGRQKIQLRIPEELYGSVIRIHVDSKNCVLKNEPRTLNFRAFDVSIVKIKHQ
jgi:hypothetical protein